MSLYELPLSQSELPLSLSEKAILCEFINTDQLRAAVCRQLIQVVDQGKLVQDVRRVLVDKAGEAQAPTWPLVETVAIGEIKIGATVKEAMKKQGGGGHTFFCVGMGKRDDYNSQREAHVAVNVLILHEVSRGRFDSFADAVTALFAGASGVHINAGSKGVETCSQTIWLNLARDDNEGLCLAAGHQERVCFHTRKEFEIAFADTRLPQALKAVLLLATAVTLPPWIDLALHLVSGHPCCGFQFKVAGEGEKPPPPPLTSFPHPPPHPLSPPPTPTPYTPL